MRPRQNGRLFAQYKKKSIFFNENCCSLIQVSLKYVSNGPNDNNLSLLQIMACRLFGAKPLSEPVLG